VNSDIIEVSSNILLQCLSHFATVLNYFMILSAVLRSCQPFPTTQPFCKMTEHGARVGTTLFCKMIELRTDEWGKKQGAARSQERGREVAHGSITGT
jgi:hypothetical protein